MNQQELNNGLKDLFANIGVGLEKSNNELYKSLNLDLKEVLPIKSGYHFFSKIYYNVQKVLSGLINVEVCNSHEVRALFLNYRFFEQHFSQLIQEYEGGGACVDKASQITKALFLYYKDGAEIAYKGEFVFRDQAEILDFFKALQFLLLGMRKQYFEWHKNYLLNKD